MKKLRIYVDTSVFGGCFDEEFQELSRAFFQKVLDEQYLIIVSDLVSNELLLAPPQVVEFYESLPSSVFQSIRSSLESLRLRNLYLNAGAVGPRHALDAEHVALATISQADLLLSWNFRHIVHIEKIRQFNAVNLSEGYSMIDIRSPREVI